MLNYLLNRLDMNTGATDRKTWAKLGRAALCAAAMLAAGAGCSTAKPPSHAAPRPAVPPKAAVAAPSTGAGNESTNAPKANKSLVLQEGDTIKISFPAAPNLDTVEAVRRDGKITLEMIGEYDAAGKTPAEVEADLKRLYGTQLVNSSVSVTVQSSAFVVYVMGAVTKPGKIISDRPLTPLQALIEAGIDDTKANWKAVQVIRTDNAGHTEKFKLNLYKVIHNENEQMPDFTLKPYDVINVPERFNFY